MYTFLMDEDKNLVATRKCTIFEKESNVDKIRFLVRSKYEDIEIADCIVLIEYLTPDKEPRCEMLVMQPDLYKGMIEYRLNVNTDMTKRHGIVRILQLSFLRLRVEDCNTVKECVLKSGGAYLEVRRSFSLDNYIPDAHLDIMNQLALEWAAKVEELKCVQHKYDTSKADDIEIIDGEVWLTSNGQKIGDPIPQCSGGGDEDNDEWVIH